MLLLLDTDPHSEAVSDFDDCPLLDVLDDLDDPSAESLDFLRRDFLGMSGPPPPSSLAPLDLVDSDKSLFDCFDLLDLPFSDLSVSAEEPVDAWRLVDFGNSGSLALLLLLESAQTKQNMTQTQSQSMFIMKLCKHRYCIKVPRFYFQINNLRNQASYLQI